VAQEFHLTRERVRQILSRDSKRLVAPACLLPLAEFWKAADEILEQRGGLMGLQTLSDGVAERFHWALPPRLEPFAKLLALSPAYWVNEKNAHIRDRSLSCPECEKVRDYLDNLFRNEVQEMHLRDAAHRLVTYCQSACQDGAALSSAPELVFFRNLIAENLDICCENNRLLSRKRWQLVYGKKLRSVVRAILEDIGEPAHYSEIAARIRNNSVNFREVKDSTVHGSLCNSPEFKIVKTGRYAMAQWETKPYRSHAEAIIDLLTDRGGPLTAREIVRVLTREGEFKEPNLHAALTTHPAFVRIGQGLYDLRERHEERVNKPKPPAKPEDIVFYFDDDDDSGATSVDFAPPTARETEVVYAPRSEGVCLDTPDNSREEAHRYTEKPPCLASLIQLCTTRLTTSYKPVLMLALLDLLDENDSLDLEIVAERFMRFYRDRRARGLDVERPETAIRRLFAHSAFPKSTEVNSILHSSPIAAFSEAGILSCSDGRISISQDFSASLRKHSNILRSKATVAIEAYFLDLAEESQ